MSQVLVDTNVLLTATAPSRRLHQKALAVFNEWPKRLRLCTSGQILREYLVVATRPPSANGLGLSIEDALSNVKALLDRMLFLEEDHAVLAQLTTILTNAECTGKRIHDAGIVATALRHGVDRLVTENTADFFPFAEMVSILDLSGDAG